MIAFLKLSKAYFQIGSIFYIVFLLSQFFTTSFWLYCQPTNTSLLSKIVCTFVIWLSINFLTALIFLPKAEKNLKTMK